MNWKDQIVKMVYLKQTLFEVDVDKVWVFNLPKVAASELDIINLQKNIPLLADSDLVDFLRVANGWDAFYQNVNLFGTADYLKSEQFFLAQKMFDVIDNKVVEKTGFVKADFLPIAASTSDIDLFLITNTGEVFWFAGDLIERFDTFLDFYLAMLDYHRSEIQFWKSQKKSMGSDSID
jgi:hypothetical protein